MRRTRRDAASLVRLAGALAFSAALAACAATKGDNGALSLSGQDASQLSSGGGSSATGSSSAQAGTGTGTGAGAATAGAAPGEALGSTGSASAAGSLGSTSAAAGPGASASSGGTAGPAGPGSSGGAVGTSAGATGGQGATPGSAPKSTILIGAYGLGSPNGASGLIQGAALGDPVAFSNAVAGWVNAHGGIAGHPIKLVQAVTDLTSSTPADQQDQAACAKFTEDNHVFAVVSIVNTTPVIYQCLARAGVIYIANNTYDPDSVFYQSTSLYSSSPATDRVAVTLASELARNGYLKDPGIKLGIASEDYPWYRRDVAKFEEELKKLGGPPVADTFYGCLSCSSDQAKTEANNGALKFRAEGINHVVLPDGSTGGNNFLLAANGAGYFPRLAMTSYNLLYLIVLNVPNPAGLAGAVAIGFMPELDSDASHAPPPSAQVQLCDKIMDAYPGAGRNNRLAEEQAQFTCDGFFLLKTGTDRAGRVDSGSFRSSVEALGVSYAPVLTFKAQFGPGRHDGGQVYRSVHFDSGCTCFVPTGSFIDFTPLP